MSAPMSGRGAGSPISGRSGNHGRGRRRPRALARFITIAVEHGAKTPEGLRVYLYTALSPDSESCRDAQHERWMSKYCLPLGELDRERIADIDRKLGLKLDGSTMAANTANRIRIIARASVQSAIEAGAIAADAWPQRSKTRARRKVARTRRSVDVRALPSPAAMAEAIDAIVTQQPGSKTYRVITAVAYYAGLRPSEVVMLRVRSTVLPDEGWGRLDVTEADISFDEPGEPKTGPRSVPIPPVLVAILREWAEQNNLTSPERLLFRTRNNTRPSGSTQADRTGPAHGTVPRSRSARSRCASTTVDMRPQLHGCAPGCRSARPRDDSGTASKHSSPPTSAPSTTKSKSATSESTRSSGCDQVPTRGRAGRGTHRQESQTHQDRESECNDHLVTFSAGSDNPWPAEAAAVAWRPLPVGRIRGRGFDSPQLHLARKYPLNWTFAPGHRASDSPEQSRKALTRESPPRSSLRALLLSDVPRVLRAFK